MRKLAFSALALLVAFFAAAQDPNFSQFFASPLTLNPAFTGKFDGNLRVAGNHRNQWPSFINAFITTTASVDAGILKNKIPENDQFGIGVLLMTDRSGNNILQANYAAVSMAYHKSLDEDGYHQLGVGFQGAYTTKRLDVSKANFEDMLRVNGFTGITAEVFNQQQLNVNYFDVNAGILYTGTTNGSNNFYLGASAYHLNRQRESFRGAQYYLQPRLTVQAGGMVKVQQYNAIHFSALHSRQANALNTLVGGAYMLNLTGEPVSPTNLFVGTWYRFGDAFIPYVGLDFNNFTLGVTYDVNTSGLKPGTNLRGGVEVSLIYIKRPSDPNLRRTNCPRF